jgi:hypothetical protein
VLGALSEPIGARRMVKESSPLVRAVWSNWRAERNSGSEWPVGGVGMSGDTEQGTSGPIRSQDFYPALRLPFPVSFPSFPCSAFSCTLIIR